MISRFLFFRHLFFVLIFVCSTAYAQQSTMDLRFKLSHQKAGEKIAILIFNENYEYATKLHGPQNDVNDLKELLVGTFGYRNENVFVIGDEEHPTAAELLLEIEKISEKISGKDVILYYAGHGFTISSFSGNFILPIKHAQLGPEFFEPDDQRTLSKERTVQANFLHLETMVKAVLQRKSPKSLVVFFNACRNGSSDNIMMSTVGNIASHRPAPLNGVAVYFAAGAGQQSLAADESISEANTLYASSLLEILKSNPTVDLRKLGTLLRNDVKTKASEVIVKGSTIRGHKQVPVSYFELDIPEDKVERGVCLVPAIVGNEETCTDSRGQPQDISFSVDPCNNAASSWASVYKTEALVSAFSSEFSLCPFYRTQAEQWLATMRSMWVETQSTADRCDAFRGFLDEYPDTSYTQQVHEVLGSEACTKPELGDRFMDQVGPYEGNICSSHKVDWDQLEKSERLVSAYLEQYKNCAIGRAKAEQWLFVMRDQWKASETANDKCEAKKSFLKAYPVTSYSAEARLVISSEICSAEYRACHGSEEAWSKLKKTKSSVDNFKINYDSCQLAREIADTWKSKNRKVQKYSEFDSKELVLILQNKLNGLNCKAGIEDGIAGGATNAAIMHYNRTKPNICERLNGLPSQSTSSSNDVFDKLATVNLQAIDSCSSNWSCTEMGTNWFVDRTKGCLYLEKNAFPGEYAAWKGECNKGIIDGYGKLQFYYPRGFRNTPYSYLLGNWNMGRKDGLFTYQILYHNSNGAKKLDPQLRYSIYRNGVLKKCPKLERRAKSGSCVCGSGYRRNQRTGNCKKNIDKSEIDKFNTSCGRQVKQRSKYVKQHLQCFPDSFCWWTQLEDNGSFLVSGFNYDEVRFTEYKEYVRVACIDKSNCISREFNDVSLENRAISTFRFREGSTCKNKLANLFKW